MKGIILILASLLFSACSHKNLEYKTLDIQPHDTSTIKINLGVEKPTMPAYLITKKFAFIDQNNDIKNIDTKRWIEPFDEMLQESLVLYLSKQYPHANIASYPWGFYKEPDTRLILSIESIYFADNHITLNAKYYLSNNRSNIVHFEKKISMSSIQNYDKTLFIILSLLYSDIAKYVK
jgi:uncharacterized lipoprotein YmbA